MPQSLAQIYVHIVFSTKDRKPWLHDGDLCDQLYAYMATLLRDNVDSPAILINGAEDHVHVLVRLSRKFPVMKIVQERIRFLVCNMRARRAHVVKPFRLRD